MDKKVKRRGRPPSARPNLKRNMVTMRMRDALKASLEEAAEANQRSLSEEIEHTLEETRFLRGIQSLYIRTQSLYMEMTEVLLGLAADEDKTGKAWDKDEKKKLLGQIQRLYDSMKNDLPPAAIEKNFGGKPGDLAGGDFYLGLGARDPAEVVRRIKEIKAERR